MSFYLPLEVARGAYFHRTKCLVIFHNVLISGFGGVQLTVHNVSNSGSSKK